MCVFTITPRVCRPTTTTMPDLTLPKKVRQLKKLLRQITSLQNRDEDGPELNAEELQKIKRKPQLEADLAAAESQLLEERAAAGEPEPTSFAEMMAPVAMADVPEELPSRRRRGGSSRTGTWRCWTRPGRRTRWTRTWRN